MPIKLLELELKTFGPRDEIGSTRNVVLVLNVRGCTQWWFQGLKKYAESTKTENSIGGIVYTFSIIICILGDPPGFAREIEVKKLFFWNNF